MIDQSERDRRKLAKLAGIAMNKPNPRYIITHQDENGERFQLKGAWEAASPSEAISLMLKEARSEDSSGYEAHLVMDETDIIE